ncbi:MAG: sulfite exporter TauE/SafE family protein [Zymomonas mobilis subsp. pomaceae]|uniref:Probable membrane transporter protein n=1 Tax=Zymomonas mobilis subsp. pomaceae (strain ATCC 29192 / DSM 22645 / JCM 10191 / CCUG 17912 / NBRC 13757 / NCIMB 11200 / NRRL B-4491 / Barker I) TaxID=579138 RepID=F8ETE3_ZYMMT|nr:sulfite exporter TauE/SafE family protein [Zymomonas mobilis]AEI37968.1 protein of unknown function DUF81 [Zymomonas mobilis subsp. pomaceae ATCC 29192]MDX5949336.1 sulfite exporter TauE/SafE family protein [Zymomonas mobilis subsp. pomaceae]GEB89932.1 UPF0721 transmembrane protein [Zymomonas mobilis subsp. pomaceae]
MSVLHAIQPLYSLSGLVIGFLVGMTGVGGGSLMTPLLILVFGIHPQTAVGTDLLYASITKSVGTGVHGFKKSVDWPVVMRLCAGSVPAAALSLWFLHSLGMPSATTSRIISVTLGIALLLTAPSVLFREKIKAWASRNTRPLSPTTTSLLTVILGFVLGVLVSISSVGAGAIGVTVLVLLYPSIPTSRIVGSDIAHAVPLTLIAGFGHWLMGAVNVPMLLSLLLGSIPGIILGSLFTGHVRESVQRSTLAIVLLVVGLRLI